MMARRAGQREKARRASRLLSEGDEMPTRAEMDKAYKEFLAKKGMKTLSKRTGLAPLPRAGGA